MNSLSSICRRDLEWHISVIHTQTYTYTYTPRAELGQSCISAKTANYHPQQSDKLSLRTSMRVNLKSTPLKPLALTLRSRPCHVSSLTAPANTHLDGTSGTDANEFKG